MKPLFLIFISFSFFSFIKDGHKNDLERTNLKGKVKCTIEYTYKVKVIETLKDSLEEIDSTKYNENGNMQEVIYSQADDTPRVKQIITKYDKAGNPIESNILILGKSHTEYFSQGRHTTFDSNSYNLVFKVTYKYDEEGNIIEADEYKDEDKWKLTDKTTFKFNDIGQEIEFCVYNAQDSLCYRCVSRYDSNYLVEVCYFKPQNQIDHKETYKRDKWDVAGNWHRRIAYKSNVPCEIIERKIEYYP